MAKTPGARPPIELDPPADALEAEKAVEILRAWIADGKLHVTFHSDTFGDKVSEWGRLLADMSHHIARGVALNGQLTEKETVTAIAEAFDRGVSSSSTVAAGRVERRIKH